MHLKKILLIYLPLGTSDGEALKRTDCNSQRSLPPLDLMYLASIAKLCEYEAKIKDYTLGGDILRDIAEYNPDYLLANITTAGFMAEMKVLADIKASFPNLKIIVKGAPFFAYNANVIYENPFINYVIYSETELTLKEILENTSEKEILGICYPNNFQCIKNEKRPFNESLDSLPLPARELVDNSIYKNPYNNKTQTVINISRGCPNNCFFCLATPLQGEKVRIRSVENVIAEIRECVDKYKITDFYFDADIFNFDNVWLINFCHSIIKENLKITWMADFYPQGIDAELAKMMYKSGCRVVNLGIESASVEILNKIGKKISLDEVKNIIKVLKKNKILVVASFILGFPWDTKDTIMETINFSLSANIDFANFNSAIPLPGSKFFGYAMLKRLADNNLEFKRSFLEPIIRTHSLSKEKIADLVNLAYRKFYFRLKTIFKTFFVKYFYK